MFHIDIESCKTCRGRVKIIACIEDPGVIEEILTHLEGKEASTAAPPQARVFDGYSGQHSCKIRGCATDGAAFVAVGRTLAGVGKSADVCDFSGLRRRD